MLLLTDGTVIAHTPSSVNWSRLTPDASGSYVNGTWSPIASMPTGYSPLYYASALLPDGRVVVMGGEYIAGHAVWSNKGAIYNPVANTWAALTAPSGWNNIGDAQCCVLPDGRFMLANPLNKSQAILDSASLTWTAVGTGKRDNNDEEGWTLLPEGTVLTVDATPSHTEKYIISSGQWIDCGNTPLNLVDASSSEIGPAVLRPDGSVFATGATGHNAVYTPGLFPTDPGTWSSAPDFPIVGGLQLDIADGPACLLPNGNVLCSASPGVYKTPTSFFEFDGTRLTQVPSVPNSVGDSSYVGNMLILPTGQVMYTDFSRDVEIYTPTGGPQPDWSPVISSSPPVARPGTTVTILGRQFNGLSQAVAYGDDATAATNYPLVRVTNLTSGHVRYCRTHDHSTMAVATGPAIVSTQVDFPADLELGDSTMQVVTNGIPSPPVSIQIAADTVSGVVTLQGLSSSVPAGIKVSVEIRPLGTLTPVETHTVPIDAAGNFILATGVPAGSYDVAVKGPNWLRSTQGNVRFGSDGIAGLSFTLQNGDVNGDNAVTLGDFALLRAAFGTSAGDAGWNPCADLNGDGSVTLADFALLRSNFGSTGSP